MILAVNQADGILVLYDFVSVRFCFFMTLQEIKLALHEQVFLQELATKIELEITATTTFASH
jgi:hypothetical protein